MSVSLGAIARRPSSVAHDREGLVPQQIHQQTLLSIQTQGKQFHDLTPLVRDAVARSSVQTGLCVLFVCHTSASLVIQENADPAVLQDLETCLARLAPEGAVYRHADEGPDDMPAHLRTALTHTSEQIPIARGRLVLGTWQAVYLWEHRQHGRKREVVVHIMGGKAVDLPEGRTAAQDSHHPSRQDPSRQDQGSRDTEQGGIRE